MSHRKKHARQHHKEHGTGPPPVSTRISSTAAPPPRLELVVKAGSSGSLEAVIDAIQSIGDAGVALSIIHRGIGPVNKTDLLNATTGSRLIIGFEVEKQPHIEELCREQQVEVRMYNIIYRLLTDLRDICTSLKTQGAAEKIAGSAKVIALFKSSRHGIIIGCKVLSGRLQLGDRFRVITAMGPVYTGRIESMHIEKDAVRQASPGQQVGIKIHDFNQARIGDLVEIFQTEKSVSYPWQPSGKILHP